MRCGITMADLRAQSHRELFLSDASEEFTASVKVDICKELSSWPEELAEDTRDSQPSFMAGTG